MYSVVKDVLGLYDICGITCYISEFPRFKFSRHTLKFEIKFVLHWSSFPQDFNKSFVIWWRVLCYIRKKRCTHISRMYEERKCKTTYWNCLTGQEWNCTAAVPFSEITKQLFSPLLVAHNFRHHTTYFYVSFLRSASFLRVVFVIVEINIIQSDGFIWENPPGQSSSWWAFKKDGNCNVK